MAATDSTGMAGSYSGYMRSVNNSVGVKSTLDAVGSFIAEDVEGCTVAGKMTSRTIGNLFDLAATLNDQCPSPAGSYVGHALRVPSTKQLLLMLTLGDKENGTFLSLLPDN